RMLIEGLGDIPGIRPQGYTDACTRHGFHLFCFRSIESELGIPRKLFLQALAAEGIPCFGGYPEPLYRQPLLLERRFGPYDGCRGVDYGQVHCPNCETICYREGAWLEQRLLLGSSEDMQDILRAIRRIVDSRDHLCAAAGT